MTFNKPLEIDVSFVIMIGCVKGWAWRETGCLRAATRHHVGCQVLPVP